VSIRLSPPHAGSGVTVPVGALADQGQGAGVFVVDTATSSVHFQPVRIVSLGEDTAVVDGALARGVTVVSLGANLLRSGEKVRLSRAQVAAQ
jgi:hypothetical protein